MGNHRWKKNWTEINKIGNITKEKKSNNTFLKHKLYLNKILLKEDYNYNDEII